jgi:metal-responsive CopG/Arc/MetJ family transcriptional regulator
MPNKPRPENRHREVRVEDQLWRDAGAAARAEGTTRSEVMREALRALVERHRIATRKGKGKMPEVLT